MKVGKWKKQSSTKTNTSNFARWIRCYPLEFGEQPTQAHAYCCAGNSVRAPMNGGTPFEKRQYCTLKYTNADPPSARWHGQVAWFGCKMFF